jgi:hypothetical protein
VDGEGIYHRVKKRNLPELEDPQVHIVNNYYQHNVYTELNFYYL